jgi:formylglycine-generating enzyme required for sulfatase activity
MHLVTTGLLLITLACALGCGGGGDASTSSNTPTPYSSTYMVLNLDGRALATPTPQPVSDSAITFVKTDRDIYVGTYLVTQAQWRAIMGTTPWSDVTPDIVAPTSATGAPAYNISHVEAESFAERLSSISGLQIVLPTAAQWRSWVGDDEYPWGTSIDPATVGIYAVVQETRTTAGPHPTGSKEPTARGIYDVVGNVRAWTVEGSLVGGSWNDGIILSGKSHALDSVDGHVRHPLCGLRVIAVP